jgi:uncharacterized membrane protein
MAMELESMAVVMPEVEGHPNRMGFRGVLTVVDVPSQRPPSGSKGHRVLLTKAAAEEALPSLLGMALDYSPSFDRHDVRRKVGVITRAEVVGRNVEVGGYLYAKDFPEIVEEIGKSGRTAGVRSPASGVGRFGKPRSGSPTPASGVALSGLRREGVRLRASLAAAVGGLRSLLACGQQSRRDTGSALQAGEAIGPLGMSYEIANAVTEDTRARVWVLSKVTFTGAAILRKDKAAYHETWIELAEGG